MQPKKVLLLAGALGAALLLSGCAINRVVESDVQAFSTLSAAPANATYRFERLPSQQVQAQMQDRLEQAATAALERVGLRRDDAAARYSVQVSFNGQRQVSYDPWGPGWGPGWGPYWGGGYWRRGWGYYGGWGGPGFPDRVIYQHQVNLVLRDLSSGQVVYETHATSEDLQPANDAVLTVMLDAALHGFPAAPQGVRQVRVTLPPPP